MMATKAATKITQNITAARPRDLKIEQVAVSDLVPYVRNPRSHSDEQIKAIAASIERFGWTNPVLIGLGDDIIAGHGRVLAAKRLGIKTVPVLRIGDLSPDERRAYVIADNQTALRAGWDLDVLRLEMTELKGMDFDLGPIGFDDAELARILKIPEVDTTPQLSGLSYAVIIRCKDENHQTELLGELESRGLKCSALIS